LRIEWRKERREKRKERREGRLLAHDPVDFDSAQSTVQLLFSLLSLLFSLNFPFCTTFVVNKFGITTDVVYTCNITAKEGGAASAPTLPKDEEESDRFTVRCQTISLSEDR